jgi:rhomboid family GlyGly-CTERM serine protease
VPKSGWLLVGLLAKLALLGLLFPAHALDWQPALATSQPWRWWTPVAVHHSAWHLIGNMAALAALAWLGNAAGLSRAMVWAWVAAWPLTHLGLCFRPELAHYGGMSGVLHAGVAVVGVHLLRARGAAWGGAVLAALALKVVLEQPWGPALQMNPSLGLSVAPWGHTSGAVAGMLCAALAWFFTLLSEQTSRKPP